MRLTVATVNSSISEREGFPGLVGPIEFTAKFNGEQILSSLVTGNQLEIHQGVFKAGDVSATTGENIVEISRRSDQGGQWMLFDYVKLETEPGPSAAFQITNITRNAATGDVTVTWNSFPGREYIVETSTDLGIASGAWDEFDDGFPADPVEGETSIVFLGASQIPEGATRFFVRIREVE